VPEGTDLAVYKWDQDSARNGRIFRLMMFQGKANKPLADYWFPNPQKRDDYAESLINKRRQVVKSKMDERQLKKEWQHNLQEGSILYSSWGYDQTNVDFYQVVAISGKSVVIREIASKFVGAQDGPSVQVVASPGHFIGAPIKKIPQKGFKDEPVIKLTSFSRAYPWDGKPKYETGSGYGH